MKGASTDFDVRRAYARDVSGLELVPEYVARPSSAEEVIALLEEAHAERRPVTPAGGQSSTTGASITDRGLLLSLRALTARLDVDAESRTVRVDAGAIVGDVRRAAAQHQLLFAPDPTSENESTIGGAIACNASGARSLRYGATRRHVRALTVALADGSVLELRRPSLEKNTVGYAMAHDPVDWFVGSEGTLGVVLSAELALLPLPQHVIGLAIPFANEHDALSFVVRARQSQHVHARCLEYLDARATEILVAAGGGVPLPEGTCLVYTEEAPAENVDRNERHEPQQGKLQSVDAQNDRVLDEWLALAESTRALTNDIRVYDSESALLEARRQRHAVPVIMNERSVQFRSDGGRRVSTDWAVPYTALTAVLERARANADAMGLEQAVTYGHAGNGHPHQNFIAKNADELHQIESLVEVTLRDVLSMGGTVAAEHGIGKLKRKWLPLQMSAVQQRVMLALKNELDPLGILAPGNVL